MPHLLSEMMGNLSKHALWTRTQELLNQLIVSPATIASDSDSDPHVLSETMLHSQANALCKLVQQALITSSFLLQIMIILLIIHLLHVLSEGNIQEKYPFRKD